MKTTLKLLLIISLITGYSSYSQAPTFIRSSNSSITGLFASGIAKADVDSDGDIDIFTTLGTYGSRGCVKT